MRLLLVMTAGLTVLTDSLGSPPMDAHQANLADNYHHVEYIASFPCHQPQPRVVRINQLLSDYQTQGKAYYPDITVLHRCDDACGVCTSGESCGPVHFDLVKLNFKVTFLGDFSLHSKGSWDWENHELMNHTMCGCHSLQSRPYHRVVVKSDAAHHQENSSAASEDNVYRMSPEDGTVETTTAADVNNDNLTYPDH